MEWGVRQNSPRVEQTDVKSHRRGIEDRERVMAWNTEVGTHHAVTYDVTALQDNDIVAYITVPAVIKMHDTPYLFDLIHFSSITHSSRRSFLTLIQDQMILQTDKYIIQLRIATILSRYGTEGNSPFPL